MVKMEHKWRNIRHTFIKIETIVFQEYHCDWTPYIPDMTRLTSSFHNQFNAAFTEN